jgi:hypothetical protein
MKHFPLKTQYGITVFFCLIFANLVQGQKQEEIVNASSYPIECLSPPDGFVTSDDVNGYLHWSTKSSILISLVNDKTIVDAEEALNEDYFQREKITLLSKEKVKTTNGEEALLYKFSFVIKEETWYRYSLFLGNLNGVLWINGSYPAKYEPVVKEPILNSLLTTKFLNR